MLDMYSDFTMHHAQLGAHVEVLEMDDLQARSARPRRGDRGQDGRDPACSRSPSPGRDKISMPVTEESLRWSARVAVGLDRLAADFDLDGLTYYYRGLDGNENEELGAGVIVGNSLLTARGIPASARAT